MAINQNETVRVTAAFDAAVAEPVNVTFKTPSGSEEGPFVMLRVGTTETFIYDHLVTEAGRYRYRVETAAPVTAEDAAFQVREDTF